jgi:hypothetical protein
MNTLNFLLEYLVRLRRDCLCRRRTLKSNEGNYLNSCYHVGLMRFGAPTRTVCSELLIQGDYEDLVDESLAETPLEKTDNYHVFARSAFGNLSMWKEIWEKHYDVLSKKARRKRTYWKCSL